MTGLPKRPSQRIDVSVTVEGERLYQYAIGTHASAYGAVAAYG